MTTAVIDTNVLVSALLKPSSPPAQVFDDVRAGLLIPLHNEHILEEYAEVLIRPKFSFSASDVDAVIAMFKSSGVDVPNAHFAGQLPDPDDRPFADVAFTGRADLLITGNSSHFPIGQVIHVVTPREWVDIK